MVLRELKSFVYSGETVESVVITIPASFDTIQSNATKKASFEAGFAEVVLLQEPIAASLAFANKQAAKVQKCILELEDMTKTLQSVLYLKKMLPTFGIN